MLGQDHVDDGGERVQPVLHMAGDHISLRNFGAAFDATVHHFPVPAFFDYPETKVALWRERSIQHILGIQRHPDVNTLQLTRTLEDAFDDLPNDSSLYDDSALERLEALSQSASMACSRRASFGEPVDMAVLPLGTADEAEGELVGQGAAL